MARTGRRPSRTSTRPAWTSSSSTCPCHRSAGSRSPPSCVGIIPACRSWRSPRRHTDTGPPRPGPPAPHRPRQELRPQRGCHRCSRGGGQLAAADRPRPGGSSGDRPALPGDIQLTKTDDAGGRHVSRPGLTWRGITGRPNVTTEVGGAHCFTRMGGPTGRGGRLGSADGSRDGPLDLTQFEPSPKMGAHVEQGSDRAGHGRSGRRGWGAGLPMAASVPLGLGRHPLRCCTFPPTPVRGQAVADRRP